MFPSIYSTFASIWYGSSGMTFASARCPPVLHSLSQPSRPDCVLIFPFVFYPAAVPTFPYASRLVMVSLVPFLVPLLSALFSLPSFFLLVSPWSFPPVSN